MSSFRTIVIQNRCKLEYSLNYMVCRGENETRVNVDEISLLIIQNPGVSMTAALLSRLMEAKVGVIFCDPKSDPQGELIAYQGSYDSYQKIMTQINWKIEAKENVWRKIVREKIRRQALHLKEKGADTYEMLLSYLDEVTPGDTTNREGHAAKVYFNSLFGTEFSRGQETFENACLNYGYALIRAKINREIKSFGYLTELGIHHIGKENPFNLSCDFMEPLRAYIDRKATSGLLTRDNFKMELIKIFEDKVMYDGNEMFLDNAIHNYVQSVLIALKENDPERVKFIDYELS